MKVLLPLLAAAIVSVLGQSLGPGSNPSASPATNTPGFTVPASGPTTIAAGIRRLDLPVRSLIYDPFTSKLYGSSSNSLVQIDPVSGEVLGSFLLGTNVTLLARGAQNGVWAAVEGEHALRRFDLEQMVAENPIPLQTTRPVVDLAGSTVEADTVAFVLPLALGVGFSRVVVVRDGALLPNVEQFVDNVAMLGNVVYLGRGAILIRMGINADGVVSSSLLADTGRGGGNIQILRPYVYRGQGDVFDATTAKYMKTLSFGGTVAVSEGENSVYFLSRSASGTAQIARYEHPSLRLTGFAELPGVTLDDSPASLAVTGTNRLAFNTATNVYLLDTEQLFLPADLEVVQTVSGTTSFSDRVLFEVTIRNKGPGTAIGVSAQDRFSSGVGRISLSGDQLFLPDVIPFEWEIITPSAPVSFTVSVQASQLGAITNSFSISAMNDTNVANNNSAMSSSVTGLRGPVSVLNFTPQLLSYDDSRQRLFFVEGSQVWSFDPEVQKLGGPVNFPADTFSVGALEASPAGAVYAYRAIWPFQGEIMKIDSDSLAMERAVRAGTLVDLEVSPAVPNTFFLSDERGSGIFKNNVGLANYLRQPVRARFSPDGTKLYTANPETCDLETYAINETGLTLIQTQTTGTCDYFQQVGGLLYFDSGLIFDPATGQKQTNSLRLAQQTLMVPRADGTIDLVSFTNQVWSVSRLDTNRIAVRRISLDNLPGAPLQAVAAGPNRVAIRTSGAGLYLVDLDPSLTEVRIAAQTNHTASITFNTVAGERYQIERNETLAGGSWAPVGQTFTASGYTHQEAFPIDQARAAFFRIIRLAN